MSYNIAMKRIALIYFGSIVLFSCKSSESKFIENSQRTDSLLKIINSPELAILNKKIFILKSIPTNSGCFFGLYNLEYC